MTTTNASIAAIALDNVGANKQSHPRGFAPRPDATPADFEVGQVVSIYSRGYYRTGAVEKVGRKNVTVLYFTETSVSQGRDRLLTNANITDEWIEAQATAAGDNAARRWDYSTEAIAEGGQDYAGNYHVKLIEEHPDRETFIAEETVRRRAQLVSDRAAARANDLAYFSLDTRKAAPANEIGVRA